MKLSDIKGERSLDIIADAMELAEMVGDDDRFTAFVEEMKANKDDAVHVMCKHVPSILRDERYKKRIVSILATAAGVPVEEYAESGPVVADLLELLTSDAESLGFLLGSASGGK